MGTRDESLVRGADFTTAVHAGVEPEPVTGALMTPIFQTSTFEQSAPGEHKGFDYSRADNPTRQALENSLAQLEGADHGLAFSSGLAAEQAIIQLLEPGSRVLICDDVYGGTGRLFRKLYARYNIRFDFVDLSQPDLQGYFDQPVDLVWVETPTNPLLKIVDLEQVVGCAKKAGAIVVVDNTFASPMLQKPLEWGVDVVVHSTTKYIGGHSDLIGGAIMTKNQELFERLKFIQFGAGSVPSPFEAFLLLRSIKTLALRMQRHCENAMGIANFLSKHPLMQRVHYPGLPSHPQHELAKRQMSGFSGMVSFEMKGSYESVVSFLSKLKLFKLAESLGGVESLINHPERMTHASVPPELRQKLGIGPNLLRLSVGIEDLNDLRADLESALGKV